MGMYKRAGADKRVVVNALIFELGPECSQHVLPFNGGMSQGWLFVLI